MQFSLLCSCALAAAVFTAAGCKGKPSGGADAASAIAELAAPAEIAGDGTTHKTEVSIRGEDFLINGKPTYSGRTWNGNRIEGLLLNSRMVQATFDDLNSETAKRWAYPDTGIWDPERNLREFLAALPEYRRYGLLAVTVNLQGGSPEGYSREQPWHNSAFTADGDLRPDYQTRMERVLDKADELGMAVILGLFYFGQDRRLKDEAAVLRALDQSVNWVLRRGWRNVLIEIDNECNVGYSHSALRPERVHGLIERVKGRTCNGRRLLVGTSYGGGAIPGPDVVAASDFLLLHGNGLGRPQQIADMIRRARRVAGYRPMPILFNEDDHFDFDKPDNNLSAAVGGHCSWGYFDPGRSNYSDGFQCPPVNWSLSTDRKRAFFAKIREIAGE